MPSQDKNGPDKGGNVMKEEIEDRKKKEEIREKKNLGRRGGRQNQKRQEVSKDICFEAMMIRCKQGVGRKNCRGKD